MSAEYHQLYHKNIVSVYALACCVELIAVVAYLLQREMSTFIWGDSHKTQQYNAKAQYSKYDFLCVCARLSLYLILVKNHINCY